MAALGAPGAAIAPSACCHDMGPAPHRGNAAFTGVAASAASDNVATNTTALAHCTQQLLQTKQTMASLAQKRRRSAFQPASSGQPSQAALLAALQAQDEPIQPLCPEALAAARTAAMQPWLDKARELLQATKTVQAAQATLDSAHAAVQAQSQELRLQLVQHTGASNAGAVELERLQGQLQAAQAERATLHATLQGAPLAGTERLSKPGQQAVAALHAAGTQAVAATAQLQALRAQLAHSQATAQRAARDAQAMRATADTTAHATLAEKARAEQLHAELARLKQAQLQCEARHDAIQQALMAAAQARHDAEVQVATLERGTASQPSAAQAREQLEAQLASARHALAEAKAAQASSDLAAQQAESELAAAQTQLASGQQGPQAAAAEVHAQADALQRHVLPAARLGLRSATRALVRAGVMPAELAQACGSGSTLQELAASLAECLASSELRLPQPAPASQVSHAGPTLPCFLRRGKALVERAVQLARQQQQQLEDARQEAEATLRRLQTTLHDIGVEHPLGLSLQSNLAALLAHVQAATSAMPRHAGADLVLGHAAPKQAIAAREQHIQGTACLQRVPRVQRQVQAALREWTAKA